VRATICRHWRVTADGVGDIPVVRAVLDSADPASPVLLSRKLGAGTTSFASLAATTFLPFSPTNSDAWANATCQLVPTALSEFALPAYTSTVDGAWSRLNGADADVVLDQLADVYGNNDSAWSRLTSSVASTLGSVDETTVNMWQYAPNGPVSVRTVSLVVPMDAEMLLAIAPLGLFDVSALSVTLNVSQTDAFDVVTIGLSGQLENQYKNLSDPSPQPLLSSQYGFQLYLKDSDGCE
jgi:hypothetical protein